MAGKITAEPARLEDYTATTIPAARRADKDVAAYRTAVKTFNQAQPNMLPGSTAIDRAPELQGALDELERLDRGPKQFASELRRADGRSKLAGFITRRIKAIGKGLASYEGVKSFAKWKINTTLDMARYPGKYVMGRQLLGVVKGAVGWGVGETSVGKALAPYFKFKGRVDGIFSAGSKIFGAGKHIKAPKIVQRAWAKRPGLVDAFRKSIASRFTSMHGKMSKAAARLKAGGAVRAKPWVQRASSWPSSMPGGQKAHSLWKGRPSWLSRKPPKVPPAVGKVLGPVGTIATAPFEFSDAVVAHKDPKADTKKQIGENLEAVGAAVAVVGAGASVTGIGAIPGVPLMAVGAAISGTGYVVKNADWVTKTGGKAASKLKGGAKKIGGWFR